MRSFYSQGHKETARTLVANICLPSDVTTPMQSSSAKSRCLICLAGEPLILKSVSVGKRLDRERDRYRLTARILGIFSPSSVQEEAGGSTLVLSAVSCEWNTERIWMLFSNMRISLTRRLPGIYLNYFWRIRGLSIWLHIYLEAYHVSNMQFLCFLLVGVWVRTDVVEAPDAFWLSRGPFKQLKWSNPPSLVFVPDWLWFWNQLQKITKALSLCCQRFMAIFHHTAVK